MILSFGYTTEALLAGSKTVTRREWNPGHAAKFTPGLLVDAWDRSPRVKPWCLQNGLPAPHKVATIRIERVRLSSLFPPADYTREGFTYMTARGLKVGTETPDEIWERWRRDRTELYVVRFEVVEYMEGPLA